MKNKDSSSFKSPWFSVKRFQMPGSAIEVAHTSFRNFTAKEDTMLAQNPNLWPLLPRTAVYSIRPAALGDLSPSSEAWKKHLKSCSFGSQPSPFRWQQQWNLQSSLVLELEERPGIREEVVIPFIVVTAPRESPLFPFASLALDTGISWYHVDVLELFPQCFKSTALHFVSRCVLGKAQKIPRTTFWRPEAEVPAWLGSQVA